MSGNSAALAGFVAATRYEDLPPEVVDRIKKSLLDALGCVVYGSSLAASQAPLRYLDDDLVRRPAVDGGRSAADEAMLNATFIHTTEYGETFARAVVHPGTVVVPAALAVCGRRRLTGRDLVTAMTVGFEVDVRLGLAAGHKLIMEQRLHAPSIWGSFASTAAVANALSFDRGQAAAALGVASCLVPSALQEALRQHATVKDIYQGYASALGVTAGAMVGSGITGPADWVEPWFAAVIDDYDLAGLVDGLGERWNVASGGLRIKTRPVMAMAQPTLEALTGLLRAGPVEAGRVDRVVVESSGRIEMGRIYRPEGIVSARAAIPFLVAAALVDQPRFLSDTYLTDFIRPEQFVDARVNAIADTVELVTDPTFDDNFERAAPGGPDAYQKYEARVTIHLSDGTVRTRYADLFAIGTGRMTWDEVAAKFHALTRDRLPPERAEAILATVGDLENCPDVGALAAMVTTSDTPAR